MTFTINNFCAYREGGHDDPTQYAKDIRVVLARLVTDLVDKDIQVSGASAVQLPDGSTFDIWREADHLRRGMMYVEGEPVE